MIIAVTELCFFSYKKDSNCFKQTTARTKYICFLTYF